ncbi:uncharacterized protein LOC127121632 [Lathyrus oleraceus]|uniref:uncharacterized protein LOC127121632 n=1 Tax=Pisum sativum TaxID=3888 RepID=UPI0021CE18E3|nr:uncharacterized protein LOC127121632 [Pisum sativum]
MAGRNEGAIVDALKIYDKDSKARSTHYKSVSERKGKIQIRGKSYSTLADKGKQKVIYEKKRSEGETPTSVRCFKYGEYRNYVPGCKSTTVNYFKCGKSGHRVVECSSNNMNCFNYGEWGHISTQSEKPKKDQSRGKVFALFGSEVTVSVNLIRGICFINNIPLITIIDMDVAHSFISVACVSRLKLEVSTMNGSMIIDTQASSSVTISLMEFNHVFINCFDNLVKFLDSVEST